LAAHAGTARPVASCGFPRLPLYFTAETLASAKVVITDRLPVPPLSSWGLTQFASFERRDPDGITYLDTCFLKPHQSKNEAIHFHELIHVIQWRVLGAERFLRSYADGLERFGYRDSPLEVMAYDAGRTRPIRHGTLHRIRVTRRSAAGAVTALLRADPAYPDISSLPDRRTRSPQMLSCVVPFSRKRSPACFAQLL
jgi:hypothetical protein